MVLTGIVNVLLAVGVIVMVVAPLVWAILTQHRDHQRVATADGRTGHTYGGRVRRRTTRPQYRPVTGRA